jgi:hypothetical protein
VRLSFFAILPARVFFRASDFRVRTSAGVQVRRFPFFMMTYPSYESVPLTAKEGGVSTFNIQKKTGMRKFSEVNRSDQPNLPDHSVYGIALTGSEKPAD